MKERVLNNWNFVRWFWLIIGISIAVASIVGNNFLMLVPAAYFILGAVLNIGCFAASCATDFSTRKKVVTRETKFDNEYTKNQKT
jgi:membrane protein implicated in regulation of membrane protease activity